jgi:hypothetical protein
VCVRNRTVARDSSFRLAGSARFAEPGGSQRSRVRTGWIRNVQVVEALVRAVIVGAERPTARMRFRAYPPRIRWPFPSDMKIAARRIVVSRQIAPQMRS